MLSTFSWQWVTSRVQLNNLPSLASTQLDRRDSNLFCNLSSMLLEDCSTAGTENYCEKGLLTFEAAED